MSDETMAGTGAPSERHMLLLEAAWNLLANVDGGDWSRQRPEWREAAQRWRGDYQAVVREYAGQVTT